MKRKDRQNARRKSAIARITRDIKMYQRTDVPEDVLEEYQDKLEKAKITLANTSAALMSAGGAANGNV